MNPYRPKYLLKTKFRTPPGSPATRDAPAARRRGTRRSFFLPIGAPPNSGAILIITIWIVMVLAGLVLVFTRAMRVDALAAANHVAQMQADAIARGAIQYVVQQVGQTVDSDEEETTYEAVLVGDGLFWVLKVNFEDDQQYAFGITDEASKLNINSATAEMLAKLPGMPVDFPETIVDWRDEDEDISDGGAESEYYLLLEKPYNAKNGPFETLDEMFLLKDATREILYGEDPNLNGYLDENENDASESAPDDNADGQLDRGLFSYLTVYSQEPNTGLDGQERINVNDNRSNGQLASLLRQAVSQERFGQLMGRILTGRPFQNTVDFFLKTQMTPKEFSQISDRITTSQRENLVGLVNVNTAPREVLLALPDLEEGDVDNLVAQREQADPENDGIIWIVEALEPQKAISIGEFISFRSYQFSADIVAVNGTGRAFKRYRIVVDTRESSPRIIYRKDLTYLGWPLDPEILRKLKEGTPAEDLANSVYGGSDR